MISLKASMTGRSPSYAGVENKSAGFTKFLPDRVLNVGQKIERKHLTLRTRIKRLARKTLCFSKSVRMHDMVIGLFMNRYAFGLQI
jgi:IS1 family transposase